MARTHPPPWHLSTWTHSGGWWLQVHGWTQQLLWQWTWQEEQQLPLLGINFVWSEFIFSETTNRLWETTFPLEQINVKSNYFKCCIYDVYNFCIFSSISDYIEHGIHDLPPRKYICVWFSLSINSTKSDRFLSLQLNFNWLKKGRKLLQKWSLKMFNFSAVSISMGIAGRSPNAD